MTLPTQHISVTLPVNEAIERVKRVLFNPFDLQKWFAIGFCAWLAHLGQRGFGGSFGSRGNPGNLNVQESIQRARDYLTSNLYWIVPVAIGVALAGLVLWVLLVWLSSRGKFMFLDCVAANKSEVLAPWHKFASQGASLFWFRLVLWLIQMIVMLPLIVFAVVLVWRMIQQGKPDVGGVLGLVGLGLALLLACLVFWIIARLTTDFVVVIMFSRGATCLQAWSILRALLAANTGAFVLYFLFQILLSMVIGACVLALILVTCCIAGCLLAIPYLGTVLFLPVLVFQRAYSLFYLRQYGPEFDALASTEHG